MDITEVIFKKIMKVNGSFAYVCLSYNKMILAYRVDVYEVTTSKRYAAYFKLQ